MEGEAGETERNTSENRDSTGLRQQDRLLPIANVSRIMKKVLPGSVKVSKDAKEMLQECVSEFISFITGESSEKCQKEKRKTINGDDLLWAMTTLGFEDYFEPLQLYLQKYREVEEEKTLTERQGEGAGAGAGEMGGSLVNWASTGGGSDGTGEIHDMLKSNGVMMRHVDERGK